MPETSSDQSPGARVAALRRSLGLSQSEFGARIGLASKSRVSELEAGGPCSLKVALAIEQLSDGRIDAADLSADVAAARARCQPEVA